MLVLGCSRQNPQLWISRAAEISGCCRPAASVRTLVCDLSPHLPIHMWLPRTHTADTQYKLQILYQFWYPSLWMGVFPQHNIFCVIRSRWMGQKCGESIRIGGRGLTEISVTAALNSNRMSDELTVNVGDGSRSSRTDGGVLLIPTFWERQVWVYDRPQDEQEYFCRLL